MFFYDASDLKDSKIYLKLNETYEGDLIKKWSPSYNFDICLLNGAKIGYCNFRVDNSEITKYCGNIGYGIDEKYRGNRYSANTVRLLLNLAKKHDLKYVLITCEVTNIASNKICKFLNAEFVEELEIPKNHEMYLDGFRKLNAYRIDIL